MDRMQIAAGEVEDQELLQSSEKLSSESNLSGFLGEEDIALIILSLQAVSGRQLTAMEEPFWKERLSKYPKWKLSRLQIEYAGPFNDKVLAFLDALQYKPEPVKSLPPPKPTSRSKQIARDFQEHMKEWRELIGNNFKMTEHQKQIKRKVEWESYKRLDIQYPELRVLEKVRYEKRFQGLN